MIVWQDNLRQIFTSIRREMKQVNLHNTIVLLLVTVLLPGNLIAAEQAFPSLEMLEFIAEFEDVDDDTFEILVFHAIEDGKVISPQNEMKNVEPVEGQRAEETNDE